MNFLSEKIRLTMIKYRNGINIMKQEFLDFVNKLIEHDSEFANTLMTENIKAYLDMLAATTDEKPVLTDSGKEILKYMQDNDAVMFKCADIAENLVKSSRAVSGALRKLTGDKFVEKVSEHPTVYALTEKGKNFKID